MGGTSSIRPAKQGGFVLSARHLSRAGSSDCVGCPWDTTSSSSNKAKTFQFPPGRAARWLRATGKVVTGEGRNLALNAQFEGEFHRGGVQLVVAKRSTAFLLVGPIISPISPFSFYRLAWTPVWLRTSCSWSPSQPSCCSDTSPPCWSLPPSSVKTHLPWGGGATLPQLKPEIPDYMRETGNTISWYCCLRRAAAVYAHMDKHAWTHTCKPLSLYPSITIQYPAI